ncbi:AAA family ATPase [candidate division KSB1 bacterium]|nr:AAA family ATPase [candidate division KSB1 bacterium]
MYNNNLAAMTSKLLKSDGNLDPKEEKSTLQQIVTANPEMAKDFSLIYCEKYHKEKADKTKLQDKLEEIKQLPYIPARFIEFRINNGKQVEAFVASGNHQAVVSVDESIDPVILKKGQPVLLNQDGNLIISIMNRLPVGGDIISATYKYRLDDGMIVESYGQSEYYVEICEELKDSEFNSGDPVLIDRSANLAIKKLQKEEKADYLVQEPPDVTLDQIGGMGSVIQSLKEHIDISIVHKDLMGKYGVRMLSGVILVSKPGCGKSMLAKGFCNYIQSIYAGKVLFLNIPPGSHRSSLYGSTEQNLRNIFEFARKISRQNGNALVIIFMDELDNFGTRSGGIGSEIDNRVMGTLLAELSGFNENKNMFFIGATNRLDLIDEAIQRPDRFGDMIYMIPSPDKKAAMDIFGKYLSADLPYYKNGHAMNNEKRATDIIQAATSYLYGENSPRYILANMTFRDGTKQPVEAKDFVTGAMIENIARKAKFNACLREIKNQGEGIRKRDVIESINSELDTVATKLKSPYKIREMMDLLDMNKDVVKVDLIENALESRAYCDAILD